MVLVALAIAGTYIYRQHVEARAHSLYIAPEAKLDCKPIVDAYMTGHPEVSLSYAPLADAGLVLGPEKVEGKAAVEVSPVPALTLNTGTRTVVLRPGNRYWLSYDGKDAAVTRLLKYLNSYHKDQEQVSLTAVGDIIPGRTVAKMMALKGVDYPFGKIASCVKGADVVYGDLEAPLSDRVKPPYKGLDFIAPSSTIQGLKMLGLNIVSLANNHSTNFGTGALTDTITLLKNNGIKYAGGGMNLAEARSPGTLEAKGVSFAFLDYNAITGSLNATATRPGVSWIRMQPWSKDSPDDMELVKQSIMEAKSRGDFVVACFHWSAEYKHEPSVSQRNMAHLACDAGADLVIGGHPHCTQPIEMYNGKLIAYSLGNFIFDQMEHDYSREGVIMKCRFNGTLLTGLELVPYVITDWCQPVAVSGPQAKKIMDELLSISGY
ncbi:MAG: CapA family protein [Candidatus Geothermincolia bacterium]